MYKRVFFGPVKSERIAQLQDIRGVDILIFVLLTVAVVWIGIYPHSLLNVMHATIANLVQISLQSHLG
jgi:NADH-quinone oxidoreductase subunit M